MVLKHKNIKIDSLLDEVTAETYINCNTLAVLKLSETPRKVSVYVISNQLYIFETISVEPDI